MRHRTPFSLPSGAADTRISPPTRSLGGNDLDAKAAEHLAAGLKENKALTSLECVAARRTPSCPLSRAADTSDPVLYSRARILACSLTPLARSVGWNKLGVEGAQIMADLLKTNTTITSLGCATARRFLYCQ